jgi:dTDP-4-dehydrorhamnose reductase
MRIVVTGTSGQVATSLGGLHEPGRIEIVRIGRPELDLENPATIASAIAAARPDLVVSAGAYTQVDKAESEPDRAFRVNAEGAGAVAKAANTLGVPVVHLSTDYVFDGTKAGPYTEDDPVAPLGVYGASKLAGEQAVAAANPRHVILRTAWVYSPYGVNFVKTMLRLAGDRDELKVVADQLGCPTSALDIADAIVAIAGTLKSPQAGKFGLFNLCGSGETSWAGFAEEIFRQSARRGGPSARVHPITTAEYPTPARRPANSRLDCSRLERVYGIRLPDWRSSLERCMTALIPGTAVH